MEEIEESQDCLEDEVSEHHPPTPDRILANEGWLTTLSLVGEDSVTLGI